MSNIEDPFGLAGEHDWLTLVGADPLDVDGDYRVAAEWAGEDEDRLGFLIDVAHAARVDDLAGMWAADVTDPRYPAGTWVARFVEDGATPGTSPGWINSPE